MQMLWSYYVCTSLQLHSIFGGNFRNLSYGKMILYRNLSYMGLFFAVYGIRTFIANSNVFGVANREVFKADFLSAEMLITLIAMLFFAGLFDLFSQVALKIGRNNHKLHFAFLSITQEYRYIQSCIVISCRKMHVSLRQNIQRVLKFVK